MADTYSPPGFSDDGSPFGGAPAYVPQEKSGIRSCLTGCLIVGALLLVIAGLGTWYVTTHIQQLVGSFAGKAVTQALEQSDLPEAEKAEILAQVNRVTDALKENRLTEAQVKILVEQLTESPLFATFVVTAIEAKYFEKSGLSDEERKEGRLSMMRTIHGLISEKIPETRLDEALQHIGSKRKDGGWVLRESVTDEELRAFLTVMKQLADDAEIPGDVEDVDPSEELKRIIDNALNPEAPRADQPDGMEMPAEAPSR